MKMSKKVMICSHAALVDVLDASTRAATLPGGVNALAAGIATSIQEPKFLFIWHLLHPVVGLLQPPHRLLQAEMTDLALVVDVIERDILAVTTLRTDERFQDSLTTTGAKLAMQSHELGPTQKQRKLNAFLSDSVVETTVGQSNDDTAITSETKKLYFSVILLY